MQRWTNGTLGDNWGAETSPSGYDLMFAQSADAIAPGIVDYALSIINTGETLVNAVNRARISVAMSDAQRMQLDAQIRRAQQGLPPSPVNQQISSQTILMIVGAVMLLLMMRGKGS